MVPVIVDPKQVKSFRTAAAFELWLSTHHAAEAELGLKIHKKASGLKTVTYAEARELPHGSRRRAPFPRSDS